MDALNVIAVLLATRPEKLIERLTAYFLRIKRLILVKLRFDEAFSNRDCIARSMYKKLFELLLNKMNGELYDEHLNSFFIVILVIVAFGNFWVNKLEQFWYNYLNEVIHQFYISLMLKIDEYEDPAAARLEIIEQPHIWFFALFDSHCKSLISRKDKYKPTGKVKKPKYFKTN